MSDLVENPKDRFSHNEALMRVFDQVTLESTCAAAAKEATKRLEFLKYTASVLNDQAAKAKSLLSDCKDVRDN